jgi:hypothetical protein
MIAEISEAAVAVGLYLFVTFVALRVGRARFA